MTTPTPSRHRSLAEWLAFIERLHPRTIELGLERVQVVLDRLQLRAPPFAVITVGGTNGKGSTCAMLEACLRAAGYRVGLYTSPHLVRYNERVRVDGDPVSDEALCASFERIDQARATTPLTYFEFGTLAAFEIFARAPVDVAVLEVGMGGRLDAVNAVDADCAIVTAVDIDHTQWLGDTREAIGREKAGILRAGRPAICGDRQPPASLLEHAAQIGAPLSVLGRDFSVSADRSGWLFRFGTRVRAGLPWPALRGAHQLDNAACALAALECLAGRFPVNQAQIRAGLLAAAPPARFQVLPGSPLRVLDVAHNAQAACTLAGLLGEQAVAGRTIAVFGMLRDKDVAAVARSLAPRISAWHVTSVGGERGTTAAELAQALRAAGVTAPIGEHPDAMAAYDAAMAAAAADDRIVVFGSFHVVGDILARLN